MVRFHGNHAGTRQVRGRRKVKPATPQERLESMKRELIRREEVYGPYASLTVIQRHHIQTFIIENIYSLVRDADAKRSNRKM